MWTAENRARYNGDDVRNLVADGVMYLPSTGCQWRYIPTTQSNQYRNHLQDSGVSCTKSCVAGAL
jgi:hypothetical protein